MNAQTATPRTAATRIAPLTPLIPRTPLTPITAATRLGRAALSLRDGWAIVQRNLAQLRHAPGEIVGALVFPVITVVIFSYIFGSAIAVPGGANYRDFLMPGMFAMTATFSVIVR